MKVSELIERLQKMPADSDVVLVSKSEGTEWRMDTVEIYRWQNGSIQVELS